MEEQSDTPRTDAAAYTATDYDAVVSVDFARDLERALATATRERDEARTLNAEWSKKAETWLATPEAAQRLQSYRDLAQQVAAAQNARDEARAEVERLRAELFSVLRGDGIDHLYDGDCPVRNALHARDPACPACKRLNELAATEAP